MNPEETTPETEPAATDPPATDADATNQQLLDAIEETNRILGVLAEQGRSDAETQTTQNAKLDTLNESFNQPVDQGSAPDQLSALQEISADTEVLLQKLDDMNGQNYETGWLLAFIIVFTIGFKAFFDHSQRW